jgi:hypothetical protein
LVLEEQVLDALLVQLHHSRKHKWRRRRRDVGL